jgi:hypothetical protein
MSFRCFDPTEFKNPNAQEVHLAAQAQIERLKKILDPEGYSVTGFFFKERAEFVITIQPYGPEHFNL